MKVTHAAPVPAAHHHGKPATAGHGRFTLNAEQDVAGKATEKSTAPARTAERQMPPGLDRVMTRLENIPAENRTHGQANAFERISRNIARYQEHHGVPAPVDGGTGSMPPVIETPAETPAAPIDPVAETPAAPVETPAEAPAATPPEAAAEAPTATPAEGATGPVAEAPVVETPVMEAPAVEAPIVEAPTVEAPTAAAPVADATPVEAATPAPADTPVAVVADTPLAVEVPVIVDAPPAGSLIDVQA